MIVIQRVCRSFPELQALSGSASICPLLTPCPLTSTWMSWRTLTEPRTSERKQPKLLGKTHPKNRGTYCGQIWLHDYFCFCSEIFNSVHMIFILVLAKWTLKRRRKRRKVCLLYKLVCVCVCLLWGVSSVLIYIFFSQVNYPRTVTLNQPLTLSAGCLCESELTTVAGRRARRRSRWEEELRERHRELGQNCEFTNSQH